MHVQTTPNLHLGGEIESLPRGCMFPTLRTCTSAEKLGFSPADTHFPHRNRFTEQKSSFFTPLHRGSNSRTRLFPLDLAKKSCESSSRTPHTPDQTIFEDSAISSAQNADNPDKTAGSARPFFGKIGVRRAEFCSFFGKFGFFQARALRARACFGFRRRELARKSNLPPPRSNRGSNFSSLGKKMSGRISHREENPTQTRTPPAIQHSPAT